MLLIEANGQSGSTEVPSPDSPYGLIGDLAVEWALKHLDDLDSVHSKPLATIGALGVVTTASASAITYDILKQALPAKRINR